MKGKNILTISLAFLFILIIPFASALPSGLVAYWPFDEDSGISASDSSGNDNHGELVWSPAWLPGIEGSSLFFDGSRSYVSVPSSSSIDNLQSFTFSAWIFPTSDGDHEIFAKHGANRQLRLAEHADGTFLRGCVEASGGDACSNSLPGSITLDSWQHVAMTYDHAGDRTVRLFLDGVELPYAEQTTAGELLSDDSSFELRIGRSTLGSREFEGKIDEPAIWNRALTAEEIAGLHADGVSIAEDEEEEELTAEDSSKLDEVIEKLHGIKDLLTQLLAQLVLIADKETEVNVNVEPTPVTVTPNITLPEKECKWEKYNFEIKEDPSISIHGSSGNFVRYHELPQLLIVPRDVMYEELRFKNVWIHGACGNRDTECRIKVNGNEQCGSVPSQEGRFLQLPNECVSQFEEGLNDVETGLMNFNTFIASGYTFELEVKPANC